MVRNIHCEFLKIFEYNDRMQFIFVFNGFNMVKEEPKKKLGRTIVYKVAYIGND